jgi:hypothetical protein
MSAEEPRLKSAAYVLEYRSTGQNKQCGTADSLNSGGTIANFSDSGSGIHRSHGHTGSDNERHTGTETNSLFEHLHWIFSVC